MSVEVKYLIWQGQFNLVTDKNLKSNKKEKTQNYFYLREMSKVWDKEDYKIKNITRSVLNIMSLRVPRETKVGRPMNRNKYIKNTWEHETSVYG